MALPFHDEHHERPRSRAHLHAGDEVEGARSSSSPIAASRAGHLFRAVFIQGAGDSLRVGVAFAPPSSPPARRVGLDDHEASEMDTLSGEAADGDASDDLLRFAVPGGGVFAGQARCAISGSWASWPAGMGCAVSRLDVPGLDREPLPMVQVVRERSWEAYMGRPMGQQVAGTCSIVSCTVCLEARHRMVYEQKHGAGSFPCWAASPRKLVAACRRDRRWATGKGASVGTVLRKIKNSGGIRTTLAPTPAPRFLPLLSWQEHSGGGDGDAVAGGLGAERVAALLDAHGPCVATFWVCPWYDLFDGCGADADGVVYCGFARTAGQRMLVYMAFGGERALPRHAAVAFGYRFTAAGEMHVRIMDNQTAAGPRRWMRVEDIDTIHTLDVAPLKKKKLMLGGRRIVYPRSIQK
ncbi:hypothetical protein ACP4OV_001857 [Aristida adscensionis]